MWLDYDPALGDDVGIRFVTSVGTMTVEVIRRSLTGNGRDGEWLRVSQHGVRVAHVGTVAELAGLGIDLADLREAD
jgi:hypothetical protein